MLRPICAVHNLWMDDLQILRPFQQFFSHIRRMRGCKRKAMCNVALPTGRGSNPGTLSQWTKATGAPLQNKPCKDGWVEEGEESPHAP